MSRFLLRSVAVFFCVSAAACGTSAPPQGNGAGGTFDTGGAADTGGSPFDTGGVDAVSGDAGGTTDAGTNDATGTDAGGNADAGPADTASADVPKTGCERDSDCATHAVGACEKPVCDKAAATCKGAPLDEGSSCDDGDVCTESDICKGGTCAGDAVICNDGKACTADVCDAATKSCKYTAIAAGGACDDGNKCTEKDACDEAGGCQGAAVVCDDGDPCTADACAPSSGCLSNPASGPCDDGDACTTDDACVDGACAGQAAACDDGNPCTDDSCDKTNGCVNAPNKNTCDDDNACTDTDSCGDDGKCIGGAAKVCDDSNACTDDSCDPKTGCVNAAKQGGEQCDDGSKCTNGDACADGKCVGLQVDCNDKSPCTKDVCDPTAGCTNTPDDSLTCDDGDACTTGDSCKAGKCVTTGGVVCDDKNPCTDDTCDPTTKKCAAKANAAACDDGNTCTENDQCADGKCGAGKEIACDDKNPCTTDTCDSKTGSCAFIANTAGCEDGNKCTTGDACADGKCAGKAVVCDDSNPCTDDSCQASDGKCGAKAKADGVKCDDGSVCSEADVCGAGKCGGKAIKCDDDNPCTDDSCDATKGCQSAPAAGTKPCDDADPCTDGDSCGKGSCQPGTKAKVCADDNVCTDDSCIKGKGCAFKANVAKCDDGNACTAPDVCAKASCGGAATSCDDSNPCTTDSCDKAKGCLHANNTAACEDGTVCTKADKCDGKGKCVPGAKIACADGNPCTTDSCDAKKGCVFPILKDGAVCDDQNGCTTGDKCTTGKCGGVGKSCDDDNPCTADSCADNKCSYKNTTGACNDGNTCTQVDTCDGAGKCIGKSPIACDDKNLCTDDSCINGVGCSFKANTKACDDGAWCTDKDTCKDGKCAGAKKDCGDANDCTIDLCSDELKKCLTIAAANGAKCDDGGKCSTNDACDGEGTCKGVAVVCDDGNPCTVDKCDAKGGACVFTLSATICKGRAVPFIEHIDYKDPDWFGSSNSKAVVWAADATPLKLTGNASLNFNNGTTYLSGTQTVSGAAVSTFLIDASKITAGAMTFAFWSYNGVDPAETPGDLTKGAQLDGRFVEFSVDGFNTVTSFALDGNLNKATWVLEALDISSFKGKKFQVRFRFDSKDGGSNKGAGWHVDTVDVYAGPIVTVKQGGTFEEPFLASNPNGWQFTTPLTGTKSAFAIDKTPAAPGGFGGTESLNFNNGVGYDDKARVSGEAWSPVIDLRGVTGKTATLWFKSWNDVGDSGATWDQRFVEVTDLAFTKVNSTQMSNAMNWKKGWVWSFVDLSDFVGKRVRMRFRFDSKDASFNAGTGWFIDDLTLDTRPLAPYASMLHCSATNLFTIGNATTTGARWAVDATGIAPKSPDCSLNFNDGKNFVCPTGATKMQGTATTASFSVPTPATTGAKTFLSFSSYQDVETGLAYDRIKVVATGTKTGATAVVKTWTVDKKAENLKKWRDHTYDISALHGREVTVRFEFDSTDCVSNATAGVAIDDIMVRADK